MDSKEKKGGADRLRINVNEDYEIRYWMEKLGVTEPVLRKAVEEVGVMVRDVEAFLKESKSRGR